MNFISRNITKIYYQENSVNRCFSHATVSVLTFLPPKATIFVGKETNHESNKNRKIYFQMQEK